MNLRINKLFIVISILMGAVLWFFGEIIYRLNPGSDSKLINILLYMIVYAVLFSTVLIIRGVAGRKFAKVGKLTKIITLLSLAFVVSVGLFEFLYELGGGKIKTSGKDGLEYLFLVDDSASMSGAPEADVEGYDEDNDRYRAVESIINNMEPTDNFSVYRFADEAKCVTKKGSVNSDEYEFDEDELDLGPGTFVLTWLDDFLREKESKRTHTKIILLTDGEPSDSDAYDIQEIIEECIKKNVSISAVGFGDPDREFLKNLTTSTGGVNVYSDNVEQLQDGLGEVVEAEVVNVHGKRNLLGYRWDLALYNILYMVMRIIFLSVIGIIWTMIKVSLIGETPHADKVQKIMGIIAVIGAVVTEILFLVGFPDLFTRLIFCILWAITLIPLHSEYDYAAYGVSSQPNYY